MSKNISVIPTELADQSSVVTDDVSIKQAKQDMTNEKKSFDSNSVKEIKNLDQQNSFGEKATVNESFIRNALANHERSVGVVIPVNDSPIKIKPNVKNVKLVSFIILTYKNKYYYEILVY